MRFIDKSTHRQEGLKIIKQYLKNHCKDPDGRFRDIKYDEDSNGKKSFCHADHSKYKKDLIALLRENQHSKCCYCLRRLKQHKPPVNEDLEDPSDQLITLEHIIPKGFTSADIHKVNLYRKAPGLSAEYVELTDKYESDEFNQSSDVEPHAVSYNNLVLSCNGTFPEVINKRNHKSKICCNEGRVRENAYPIYLHSDVPEYIVYLRDGDIQAKVGMDLSTEVDEMITNTKIHCDSLKQIRFLWYALRNEDIRDIMNAEEDEKLRNDLLCRTLYTSEFDYDFASQIHDKFSNRNQWHTFLLYDAFHDIMKGLYPGSGLL